MLLSDGGLLLCSGGVFFGVSSGAVAWQRHCIFFGVRSGAVAGQRHNNGVVFFWGPFRRYIKGEFRHRIFANRTYLCK
jgi:hypothetical protein